MTTTASTGDQQDAVTALLLMLTQHAERLAALDQREAGHYQQITASLAELTRHLAQATGRLDAIGGTATRQAAILDSLDGLDQQVAALATRLTTLAAAGSGTPDADAEPGQPAPAPRWWKLRGQEREEAIGRLRAWVDQVYRPGYGHLAVALGTCWDQHPLCLYGLDWLMELWSLCYLNTQRHGRALASQAEWQTRLLPALAEQMHLETTRCHHARPRSGYPRPPAPGSNDIPHAGQGRPAADR